MPLHRCLWGYPDEVFSWPLSRVRPATREYGPIYPDRTQPLQKCTRPLDRLCRRAFRLPPNPPDPRANPLHPENPRADDKAPWLFPNRPLRNAGPAAPLPQMSARIACIERNEAVLQLFPSWTARRTSRKWGSSLYRAALDGALLRGAHQSPHGRFVRRRGKTTAANSRQSVIVLGSITSHPLRHHAYAKCISIGSCYALREHRSAWLFFVVTGPALFIVSGA